MISSCVGGYGSCIGLWGAANASQSALIVSFTLYIAANIFSSVFAKFFALYVGICADGGLGCFIYLYAPFFQFRFLPEIHKYHTGDICISKNRTAPIGRTLARSREGKGTIKSANLPEVVTECLTAPRRGARGGEASVFFYAPRLVRGASGRP